MPIIKHPVAKWLARPVARAHEAGRGSEGDYGCPNRSIDAVGVSYHERQAGPPAPACLTNERDEPAAADQGSLTPHIGDRSYVFIL